MRYLNISRDQALSNKIIAWEKASWPLLFARDNRRDARVEKTNESLLKALLENLFKNGFCLIVSASFVVKVYEGAEAPAIWQEKGTEKMYESSVTDVHKI